MDLANVPVVDNHCHFFSPVFDREIPLHRVLTLSLNDMPDEQLRHSLFYRHTVSALARLLNVTPDESIVLEARESAASQDYGKYVRTLMSDVRMAHLVLDVGLQRVSTDTSAFESILSCPVHYVYRIETIVDELWKNKVPPDEGIQVFRDTVTNTAAKLSAIALKSVIGYRTGLEIDPTVDIRSVSETRTEGSYRSLFFMEAAKICNELSIPLHVHAAFGESNIDVRRNNPLHLKMFLDSPAAKEINLVLIHGGYPYAFEGGYLAAMYPNVYVDFSEVVPFVSLGMRRAVEDYMSMCPMNKLMYGSDGFDLPETHWYGAVAGKELLSEILDSMVSSGKLDASYAEEVAHMILYQNSMRLHRFD